MKKNGVIEIVLLLNLICANSISATEMKVPKENISFWSTNNSIKNNNNCYNYSTNRVTNNFAQPGDASRNIYTEMTCDDIYKSASSDLGLQPTEFFEFTTESDFTLIALVVSLDEDFHWYRRDNNNMWSHKPGSDKATKLDNSGKPITSPETADRGIYTKFCGYFKIKNFPVTATEQNAGQVRIGNMKKLPNDKGEILKKSYIELQKYSGRPNPRIDLDLVLTKVPQLQKTLLKKINSESLHPQKPYRLGEERLVYYDDVDMDLPIDSILTAEQILVIKKLFKD